MKRFINYGYYLISMFYMILFSPMAMAQGSPQGFGQIAQNLNEGPLTGLMGFMTGACYLIGIALIVIGLNNYMRHRRNPQETPLSTVILYILLGLILIILPLTYKLVTASNGAQ